jgi:HPt (histidine-containing phosphotransfer) domain-containing protein
MVLLISATAALVLIAIAAAIYTGHIITRLKSQLAALERQKMAVHKHLKEAEEQAHTIKGTLKMLEKKKAAMGKMREKLETELEQLQEEVLPEREISEVAPSGQDSTESDDSSGEKQKSQKEAAPEQGREIKVRIPMERKGLDFDS